MGFTMRFSYMYITYFDCITPPFPLPLILFSQIVPLYFHGDLFVSSGPESLMRVTYSSVGEELFTEHKQFTWGLQH